MRIAMASIAAALLVLAATATHAQDRSRDAETAKVAWGETVNGLQLGLAPPVATNALAPAVADRANVIVQVFLRNTSKSPIPLLASVHTCLLGEGGANGLLVSRLVLKPKAAGDPLIVAYQGWNHLSLLDQRRLKSEQPQQTLNRSFGNADVQLSPADASRMTTVLLPGETRATQIAFSLSQNNSTRWQLDEATSAPPGTYEVTAVLTVAQELSKWKGELTSGPVEISVLQPAAK